MHKGIIDYLRFREEAAKNLQRDADQKQLQSIALADEAVVMREKAKS